MTAARPFDPATDRSVATSARRPAGGPWGTRILGSIAVISGLAATAIVIWGVTIVLAP